MGGVQTRGWWRWKRCSIWSELARKMEEAGYEVESSRSIKTKTGHLLRSAHQYLAV